MVAEQRCSTTSAEMAGYLQRVGEQPSELLVEEWNALSVIYKNALDSRRAARRVITSIEQNEKPEGKEQLVSHAREYIAEVERELQKIRDGILAIMDKNLIPSASTDESKVLYYKMKSDYYRYPAECATGDAKGKAAEGACVANAEATKTSERDLVAIHPVRLGTALNTPVVAQRQIPMDQTVQKTVETPQLQCIDEVIDNPVVQVPRVHVVEKRVEIPLLDVVEKIVETPEIQTGHSIQDRIQQRTLEQIVDTPIPQVVAEAPKDFSQNRVQQSSMEQTIAKAAISLAEKIIEMPVTRTQDKTQHVVVVNTHVQHHVNAVEAEKSTINEKINQVTKHAEVPQVQVVEKTVGIPQLEIAELIVETPETQTIQGARTSERSGTASVCQVTQAVDRPVPVLPAMTQQRDMMTDEVAQKTVEVARVIPQELVTPAGERTSVRERIRRLEVGSGMWCTSAVEVPRAAPGDRQREDAEAAAPNKRRKHDSDPGPRAPVHFSLCDSSSDLGKKSVDDSTELETSRRPDAQLKDITAEMRDMKSELMQVRELVGVLVRRERCTETKAEMATRRLNRMEEERDQESEAECEATLEEALVDHSKVVKVLVDKWFVDKGFGFGKTPTGQIVFIHASAVQGAEVLKIGTDARVQVVNDDARAQGGIEPDGPGDKTYGMPRRTKRERTRWPSR